jgi:hypothetical protein
VGRVLLEAVAMVQATTRERVREYRFGLRLIEAGALWSEEAFQTFKRSKLEASVRYSPSGFRRYREEMERNGFELVDVRVVRGGTAA